MRCKIPVQFCNLPLKFIYDNIFTTKIVLRNFRPSRQLDGNFFAGKERTVEIRKMNLRDLIPADYNPRVELKSDSPEWEALNESIGQFGYILPIIWNEDTGNIVGGHQRRNILLERGQEEEDVVVVHLQPDDEKILNVLLNKTKGIWDVAKLTDLIAEIKQAGGNMKSTGFTELEISLIGEDFGHIEDLLDEDFSDVGKKESDTFVSTFTLPETEHQRVNRYVEDYGKLALSKAVMDKVRGLK